MTLQTFQKRVSSAQELEALIGSPSELVLKKQLAELDEHMKSFIAESPFMLLATCGSDDRCDVSPRGDLPSVARVLDAHTLVIAERPGNRRADSLRNIIDTGRAGLLFLVPGRGESLRINGRACVMRDARILQTLAIGGKQPIVGIGVEVQECYFQCAKALLRSKLWERHPDHPEATPDHFAKMLLDQTGIANETIESLGKQIEDSYRNRLY